MKLTRKEIKEGLEQIPVEKLLLGTAAHGIGLTKKQKAFANEVVKSGNKTKAYKAAYNHTGKPETASRNAQTLANDTKVATYIAALEAAEQARAYLVPARLRDLAIHKITEKALDPAVPPAQQLKALELLGKITEVSLFTHRIETVQTVSSSDMRDKLMESIRMAISNSKAIDVESHNADDLLAEIARGRDYADDVSYSELDSNDDVLIDDVITGTRMTHWNRQETPQTRIYRPHSPPNPKIRPASDHQTYIVFPTLNPLLSH